MKLTGEQKESILKLGGYKFDGDFWWTPNVDHLRLCEEPNLESLDVLTDILERNLRELWGERFSITIRHYESDYIQKPKEVQWHITLARWEVDPPRYEKGTEAFVIRYGAFGETQVEAYQNVLLKLAANDE